MTKINVRAKGQTAERQVCKLLTSRFGLSFSRTVGSGNRWSQADLPEHAALAYSGDVCCPVAFGWVLEVKSGYPWDLATLSRCAGFSSFLEQAELESERTGLKPMVLWKKDRKPWLACIREGDLGDLDLGRFGCRQHYLGWVLVRLDLLLLAAGDRWWFPAGVPAPPDRPAPGPRQPREDDTWDLMG